jgi:peptidyl-prolyl cis-trans isomerase A (cyclophilin A)
MPPRKPLSTRLRTLLGLGLGLLVPAAALAQTSAPLPDAPSAMAHTAPAAVPTGPTVLFDTSMGRLTCQLFDQEAPQTTANFIGLATGTKPFTDPATHQQVTGKRYYDGTQFHRVIPEFMIQGGDPLATGTGDAGFYIPDEISPSLRFDVPGRLAMANSGPNTNSSQFFITEVPKPELNGHYTIFGQCDPHSVLLVASIARVERDPMDKPITPVTVNKVTVIPAGQPVPPDPTQPAPAAPAPAPARGTVPTAPSAPAVPKAATGMPQS